MNNDDPECIELHAEANDVKPLRFFPFFLNFLQNVTIFAHHKNILLP